MIYTIQRLYRVWFVKRFLKKIHNWVDVCDFTYSELNEMGIDDVYRDEKKKELQVIFDLDYYENNITR